MRRSRVVATGALAMVLAGVWTVCAEWPGQTSTAKRIGWNGLIELEDGRRVSARFTDKGLYERHQRTKGGPWSAPKLLYPRGDSDCGAELSAYGDTVALVAGYSSGCHAGEPAEVVIAGVSSGDLDEWETDTTEGMDAWRTTRFSLTGYRVVFRSPGGAGTDELSWRQSIGFTG
ncbi:hypothetical protein ACFW9D_15895 [Streptomyces sp. NPDC059524]|uniref:hypothetical protein n=1 Tax=Streptomyces sp. NPDC059524 TaxID=3346856 RepID=UPI003674BC10